MKKYLLLVAGLLLAVPYGQAEAKAVKLGRGNAYSVAADANVNTGASGTQLKKGECETNEECPSDKKCMGYKCVDVCTQPTGKPGMARICRGSKCIADPNTPHAFKCVDNCYNVVCKSGYTTEVTSDGCCCVATSCPSGQRLENGKCVANCTGVTCKSGYKAVSNSTGCCCEADTSCPTGKWLCSQCGYIHEGASTPIKCPQCGFSKFQCLPSCKSGYSYNTTYKGCIKDTLTCNIGCNVKGCGIGSTLKPDTGYYIKSDGTCPACSSAIANCAACSISKLGDTPKCTKCNAGYYLSSGKCVACPLNGICDGTSFFTCKSGYVRYNGACRTDPCDGISSTPKWCQDGFTRVEGKGCCPPGANPNKFGACKLCAVREPDLAVDCGNCHCGAGYIVVRNGMTCSCEWDGVTFPAKTAKVCF